MSSFYIFYFYFWFCIIKYEFSKSISSKTVLAKYGCISFNFVSSVPNFFTTDYNLIDPQTARYRQPIELLVWQINYLQHQVAVLRSAINAISGGTAPLGDIKVKSITFVEDGVPATVVTPRYGLRYIKPGQFQTRE